MRRLIPMMILMIVCAIAVQAQIFSDDFNDGVPDPVKWAVGSGVVNDQFNFFPGVVIADESSGLLIFTHPGNFVYGTYLAYLSNAAFDLHNRRSSALIDGSGGAWIYLAVGIDNRHFARIAVQTVDGSQHANCELWDGDKRTVGACITQSNYGPQTAYLAIRVLNNGKVVFESSPDGLSWTSLGSASVARFTANDCRIELGGGGYFPSTGGFGLVDNLRVE